MVLSVDPPQPKRRAILAKQSTASVFKLQKRNSELERRLKTTLEKCAEQEAMALGSENFCQKLIVKLADLEKRENTEEQARAQELAASQYETVNGDKLRERRIVELQSQLDELQA